MPGFVIVDSRGNQYLLKFDSPQFAELSSAADVIGSKLFYALGYNTPENYLATMRREALVIDPTTRIDDRDGRPRPMTPRDLDDLLKRAARNSDGTYRVLASKGLSGRPLGPFRYYGTRPDDPNDLVPHQHRRELRALRVFGAWTNLTDLKAANTLDALTTDRPYREAVGWVKAREALREDAGTHFDPAIVAAYDTIPDDAFERIREGIA